MITGPALPTWLHSTLTRPRTSICVAMTLVIAASLASAGFCQIFSTMVLYDDEGYVMLSLKSFLAGHGLYDETLSQYGPAFFAVSGAFHKLTQLPITHDVIRLKSLSIWLLTSFGCAGFVWRESGRWSSAWITMIVTFFHLDRLSMEPGHPQEVILMTITGLLVLSTLVDHAKFGEWSLRGLGILLAVAATTKLNLGVFLGASLALSIAGKMPRGRLRTSAIVFFGVCGAMLPCALAKSDIFLPNRMAFPVILLMSWIAVCVTVHRHAANSPFSWQAITSIAFPFLATSCAMILFLFATGTSWAGAVEGLWLQNLRMVTLFNETPMGVAEFVPWAAVSVILAFQNNARFARWVRVAAGFALAAVLFKQIAETFLTFQHGAIDRSMAVTLAGCAPPIAWVLLHKQRGTNNATFSRTMLAAMVALLPLQAFPIQGTQMALGTLPSVIAIVLLAGEAWRYPGWWSMKVNAVQPALIGIATLTVIVLGCRNVHGWMERNSRESLSLPGASLVRLGESETMIWRELAKGLKGRYDTFFQSPVALNSLYLLTGIEPPSHFNVTMNCLLTERHQISIIEGLERAERPCVILARGMTVPPRFNTSLLTHYTHQNYQFAADCGIFQIWERKPRVANAATTDLVPDAIASQSERD